MYSILRKPFTLILLANVLLIGGCYRVDVPQGNVITEEDIQKVEIGMSRDEVLSELGTPLVTDPFHAERWDYFYSVQYLKRSDDAEQNITLIFENDRLTNIEGKPEITEKGVISHNEFTSQQRKKRGRGIFTRVGDMVTGEEETGIELLE